MKLRSGNTKYLIVITVLLFVVLPVPQQGFTRDGIPGKRYGKTVTALYRSSDGYTDQNNPVRWWFENILKQTGLSVDYHDLDRGIPDLPDDARAVITWFNTGMVRDRASALDYIAFLNRAVDSGRKIVVLNSFGAYGYKEGNKEKWDLVSSINPLFKKMGFLFKGYWTNDPKKLKIVKRDRAVVEHGGRIDLNIARHYQQIVPVRSEVTTHLAVRRTDRVRGMGDGVSSVILTSQNGGFAMERYVIQNNKLMLDPAAFIRSALFYNDGYQDVAVIVGDVTNPSLVSNNIYYACKYAKIKHTFIDIGAVRSMVSYDLAPYDAVIIATDGTDKIPPDLIRQYAERGGSVVFINAVRNMDEEYKKLLGVKTYGQKALYIKNGYREKPGFYMNYLPERGKGYPVSVRKAELRNAKVLITAGDTGSFPLLWERRVGKGNILYWNFRPMLYNKIFRGTVVQSIHYLRSGFVTGLANIGMVMIDDFPAPLWNVDYKPYRIKYYTKLISETNDPALKKKLTLILERLKKYSKQTDTSFVYTTWFKDMAMLAKKIGFQYSTFLIFNYNRDTDKSKSDFYIRDFYLAEGNATYKMALHILEQGWELGFHGFNHMSLTMKRPAEYNSTPWPDRASMEKATALAYNEWISLFGKQALPVSYVAPHNIIDDTGLKALGRAFPSLQVVCALYTGSPDERSQEFEWTADRRFFQVPRITSGYALSAANLVFLHDVLHNMGVVSHFVHPDDVFDEHRSFGFNGWEWMRGQFARHFMKVKRDFPWLRWMTVRDAYNELLFYNNTGLRAVQAGKKIVIETTGGSDKFIYFRVRLPKGRRIRALRNCRKVYSYKKTGDVILKTNQYRSEVLLQ